MSRFTRSLTAGVAATLLLPATVSAHPTPDTGSIFSVSNIAGGLFRVLVSYGRMVADIRYDSLEIDAQRGQLILRDLEFNGLGKYADCQVSLGQLHITGMSLWTPENAQVRLNAHDIAVANNCFGANAAMIAMVTGGNDIPISDLTIETRQAFGRGALVADIEINSPQIARIEGTADFDYVSIYMPGLLEEMFAPPKDPWDMDSNDNPFADPDEFNPFDDPDSDSNPFGDLDSDGTEDETPKGGLRGTLKSAHLSVENLGIWERIQPLIPPSMVQPGAMDVLITSEPGSTMHGIEQDLAEAIDAFIAEPGRITAEIRPEQPIDFESTAWTTPQDAAEALRPKFSNALPTPAVRLIANPGNDDGDPRALGLALAKGTGAPRNASRAIELLTPLKEDGEVALALAELTQSNEPAEAYALVLAAAQAETPGALSALSRIEATLPIVDILAAQQAATDAELPDEVFTSAITLRDAALAREKGVGQARSYALAWRLASLAAATGDSQSQSLMDRLDMQFGDDSDWAAARNKAAELAAEDWIERELATRFAAE